MSQRSGIDFKDGSQDLHVSLSPCVFATQTDHPSTGITGYIAGDAAYALYKAHPEYEYTALVRTQEKANLVKKAYASIRITLGDLNNSELLNDEASKADIVLRECLWYDMPLK